MINYNDENEMKQRVKSIRYPREEDQKNYRHNMHYTEQHVKERWIKQYIVANKTLLSFYFFKVSFLKPNNNIIRLIAPDDRRNGPLNAKFLEKKVLKWCKTYIFFVFFIVNKCSIERVLFWHQKDRPGQARQAHST